MILDPMTTVLVANRGEVVLRVFRTARRLGMRCIAVYSEADEGAPFVRAADLAIPIGGPAPGDSYLVIDRIVEAGKETEAQLVHPGYGFLAEDPEFAGACEAAGLAFVGPPAAVLRAMGAKDEARLIAARAGVQVAPGFVARLEDSASLSAAAEEIGYPVIVKPAGGGGGKGMAVAHTPFQLEQALGSARRIAASAFGNDRLLIESYLPDARHVEVQIFADHHGNVIHLGERDCSLQRRHQKVMEETPSPAVDERIRNGLVDSATALARASGYRNAGTCEFVVDQSGSASFIEMNARLQVEHPVTEMTTGLDLVELQLRVAMGEPLPVSQQEVSFTGHSIQVRIYAEDPGEDFLPQAGQIHHLRWPQQARVDTGVEEDTEVSPFYDPMVAKVIVHRSNRSEALSALRTQLADTEILGVRTNLGFLQEVLGEPAVAEGRITTTWLEARLTDNGRELDSAPVVVPEEPIAIAAAAEAHALVATSAPDPWVALGPWRAAGRERFSILLRAGDEETPVEVFGRGPYVVGAHTVCPDDEGGCHGWTIDGRRAAAARGAGRWFVWWEGRPYEIGVGPMQRRLEEAGGGHLEAPMPGQVIAVRVQSGDRVTRGQELVVVEAMKMEHIVRAPSDGVVTAVLCEPGDQVDRGQTLVDFEPA